MVSQLQVIITADLYYICQMADRVTEDPFQYIRHIEEIFGDAASASLSQNYPKWTCFHSFLESIVSSVILENMEKSEENPGRFWVDHLMRSNGILYSKVSPTQFNRDEYYEYFDALQQQDLIGSLCEGVAKQVFHVLFSNRGTMSAFGHMVSGYVLETTPTFSPDAFTISGHLRRSRIPSWAKNAVFHRDKGKCVLCRTDLTRLFSQSSQIHYDHILPLALGGMNCVTNLQLTCSVCNQSKGARSAETSREYEAWYDY